MPRRDASRTRRHHDPRRIRALRDFGLGGLTSGGSPDRLDALVWAVTELTGRAGGGPRIRAL
jgi:phage terminase large subunit-like protein